MRFLRSRTFLTVLWLAAGGFAAAQAQITGVAYVRVQVPDAEKSAVFYEQVIGIERMPAQPGGDGVVVLRIGRSQYLELVTGAVPAVGPIIETGLLSEGNTRPAVTDPDNQKLVFAGVRRAPGGRGAEARPAPLSDHLLHVGLFAKNLDRSQAFYSALGCRTEWRGPTPDDVRLAILRVSPTSRDFVELVAPPAGPPQPDWTAQHICLAVPDINGAYKTLVARGADSRRKPRIASNGHWVINLADPNGVRVELMEPEPARR